MNISEERITEIINGSKCLNGDNAALWAKEHGVEKAAAEHVRKNTADAPGAIGVYMSTYSGDPARYIIVLHVAQPAQAAGNKPFWQIIGIDRTTCTKEEAAEVTKAMALANLDMIRDAIRNKFPNAEINEKFLVADEDGKVGKGSTIEIEATDETEQQPPQEGFGA